MIESGFLPADKWPVRSELVQSLKVTQKSQPTHLEKLTEFTYLPLNEKSNYSITYFCLSSSSPNRRSYRDLLLPLTVKLDRRSSTPLTTPSSSSEICSSTRCSDSFNRKVTRKIAYCFLFLFFVSFWSEQLWAPLLRPSIFLLVLGELAWIIVFLSDFTSGSLIISLNRFRVHTQTWDFDLWFTLSMSLC